MDRNEIKAAIKDLCQGLFEAIKKRKKAEKDAHDISLSYPEYLNEALGAVEKLDNEIWEFKNEIVRLKSKLGITNKKLRTTVVETGTEQKSWYEAVQDYFKLKEADSLKEMKDQEAIENEEKRLAELVKNTVLQAPSQPHYKNVNVKTSAEDTISDKQVKWAGRRALAGFSGNIKW